MGIRKATLEESMEAQRDHARRCREMVQSGIVVQTPENEKISYSEVAAIIPKYIQPKVVDLGCQDMKAYSYLLEVMPDMEYIGIEILPETVAKLEKEYPERKVLQGYAERLPLDTNTIDVVWARHVLEHSTDIAVVLSELRRVLRPGGSIAFTVPCGVHNEPAHYYEIERQDWHKIFIDNGFDVSNEGQHSFNLNEYFGLLRLGEENGS